MADFDVNVQLRALAEEQAPQKRFAWGRVPEPRPYDAYVECSAGGDREPSYFRVEILFHGIEAYSEWLGLLVPADHVYTRETERWQLRYCSATDRAGWRLEVRCATESRDCVYLEVCYRDYERRERPTVLVSRRRLQLGQTEVGARTQFSESFLGGVFRVRVVSVAPPLDQ